MPMIFAILYKILDPNGGGSRTLAGRQHEGASPLQTLNMIHMHVHPDFMLYDPRMRGRNVIMLRWG